MRPIDADALQNQLSRKKSAVCAERYTEGFNDALLRFKSMIHAAPTVQTERRIGQWIYLDKDNRFLIPHMVKCSLCGVTLDLNGINAGRWGASYCPNCGAVMKEEQK